MISTLKSKRGSLSEKPFRVSGTSTCSGRQHKIIIILCAGVDVDVDVEVEVDIVLYLL